MKSLVLLCVSFVLLVLAGCSADQVFTVHADGSGEASIRIELAPAFSAYLEDLSATLGDASPQESPGADGPDAHARSTGVFDTAVIRESFAAEPGLSLVSMEIPDAQTLDLVVEFESPTVLLSMRDSRLARIFRFERADSLRRLAVRLDRDAVESLVHLAGVDPFVVDSLLPPEGDMTPAEYRDYLVWALEEYESDQPIATVIEQSEIVTRITPSGTIHQVRGGVRSDNAVVYETPLLDAVTTPVPLDYSLIFSP